MTAMVGMGIAHVPEDTLTGYPVDVAIPELRIAVEIDGPSHFARTAHRPLGSTALKRRHLEAMGWAVLSVTQRDWATGASLQAKLQQLRELVQARRLLLGRV